MMHSILSFFTKTDFYFATNTSIWIDKQKFISHAHSEARGGARKGNISLSSFQSDFPGFPGSSSAILVDSSTFPLVYCRILNLSDGKRRSWSFYRQKIKHSDEFM